MNKEYERVRGEIARMLCDKQNPIMSEPPDWAYSFWDKKASDVCKDIYRRVADQILSIKGIAILSDDQSYPPIPRQDIVHIIMERDTMLREAGFVKVVKEEK